MRNREPIDNRSPNQISDIITRYLLDDLIVVVFSFAFIISVFVVIIVDIDIWLKILIPFVLSNPVAIKFIFADILIYRLYDNESTTVVVENPSAKLLKTPIGGGVHNLRGLRIKGLVNGKKTYFFAYPLKESADLFLEKEKEINSKESVELRIIEGTHVIDDFYEEKRIRVVKTNNNFKRSKQISCANHTSGKVKIFDYVPVEVADNDLLYFLKFFSTYEELYFANDKDQYVLVRISVFGNDEKRYITIDKTNVDNPDETIEWLAANGYIINKRLQLLAIADFKDPIGFSKELYGVRDQWARRKAMGNKIETDNKQNNKQEE